MSIILNRAPATGAIQGTLGPQTLRGAYAPTANAPQPIGPGTRGIVQLKTHVQGEPGTATDQAANGFYLPVYIDQPGIQAEVFTTHNAWRVAPTFAAGRLTLEDGTFITDNIIAYDVAASDHIAYTTDRTNVYRFVAQPTSTVFAPTRLGTADSPNDAARTIDFKDSNLILADYVKTDSGGRGEYIWDKYVDNQRYWGGVVELNNVSIQRNLSWTDRSSSAPSHPLDPGTSPGSGDPQVDNALIYPSGAVYGGTLLHDPNGGNVPAVNCRILANSVLPIIDGLIYSNTLVEYQVQEYASSNIPPETGLPSSFAVNHAPTYEMIFTNLSFNQFGKLENITFKGNTLPYFAPGNRWYNTRFGISGSNAYGPLGGVYFGEGGDTGNGAHFLKTRAVLGPGSNQSAGFVEDGSNNMIPVIGGAPSTFGRDVQAYSGNNARHDVNGNYSVFTLPNLIDAVGPFYADSTLGGSGVRDRSVAVGPAAPAPNDSGVIMVERNHAALFVSPLAGNTPGGPNHRNDRNRAIRFSTPRPGVTDTFRRPEDATGLNPWFSHSGTNPNAADVNANANNGTRYDWSVGADEITPFRDNFPYFSALWRVAAFKPRFINQEGAPIDGNVRLHFGNVNDPTQTPYQNPSLPSDETGTVVSLFRPNIDPFSFSYNAVDDESERTDNPTININRDYVFPTNNSAITVTNAGGDNVTYSLVRPDGSSPTNIPANGGVPHLLVELNYTAFFDHAVPNYHPNLPKNVWEAYGFKSGPTGTVSDTSQSNIIYHVKSYDYDTDFTYNLPIQEVEVPYITSSGRDDTYVDVYPGSEIVSATEANLTEITTGDDLLDFLRGNDSVSAQTARTPGGTGTSSDTRTWYRALRSLWYNYWSTTHTNNNAFGIIGQAVFDGSDRDFRLQFTDNVEIQNGNFTYGDVGTIAGNSSNLLGIGIQNSQITVDPNSYVNTFIFDAQVRVPANLMISGGNWQFAHNPTRGLLDGLSLETFSDGTITGPINIEGRTDTGVASVTNCTLTVSEFNARVEDLNNVVLNISEGDAPQTPTGVFQIAASGSTVSEVRDCTFRGRNLNSVFNFGRGSGSQAGQVMFRGVNRFETCTANIATLESTEWTLPRADEATRFVIGPDCNITTNAIRIEDLVIDTPGTTTINLDPGRGSIITMDNIEFSENPTTEGAPQIILMNARTNPSDNPLIFAPIQPGLRAHVQLLPADGWTNAEDTVLIADKPANAITWAFDAEAGANGVRPLLGVSGTEGGSNVDPSGPSAFNIQAPTGGASGRVILMTVSPRHQPDLRVYPIEGGNHVTALYDGFEPDPSFANAPTAADATAAGYTISSILYQDPAIVALAERDIDVRTEGFGNDPALQAALMESQIRSQLAIATDIKDVPAHVRAVVDAYEPQDIRVNEYIDNRNAIIFGTNLYATTSDNFTIGPSRGGAAQQYAISPRSRREVGGYYSSYGVTLSPDYTSEATTTAIPIPGNSDGDIGVPALDATGGVIQAGALGTSRLLEFTVFIDFPTAQDVPGEAPFTSLLGFETGTAAQSAYLTTGSDNIVYVNLDNVATELEGEGPSIFNVGIYHVRFNGPEDNTSAAIRRTNFLNFMQGQSVPRYLGNNALQSNAGPRRNVQRISNPGGQNTTITVSGSFLPETAVDYNRIVSSLNDTDISTFARRIESMAQDNLLGIRPATHDPEN